MFMVTSYVCVLQRPKMFRFAALFVLVLTSLPAPGAMQGNGALRLAGKDETLNRTMIGRLEIFLDGEWGTVCGPINRQSVADTACNQLGLGEATIYGSIKNLLITEANESTPILIGFDQCDDIDKPQHLLKCSYTRDPTYLTEYCSHEFDAAVQCDGPINIYSDTQVRLTNGIWSSSGVLEVYLFAKGKWSTVCFSGFNQAAADSACRQLGYTNATSFTGVNNPPGSTVWISSTICRSSQPCFNKCLPEYPETPVSQCSGQGTVVFLNCTFDISEAKLSTTQNTVDSTCSIYAPPLPDLKRYYFIGAGVGAVIVVLFIIVFVVVSGVIVFKVRSKRSRYVQVDSKGDAIN